MVLAGRFFVLAILQTLCDATAPRATGNPIHKKEKNCNAENPKSRDFGASDTIVIVIQGLSSTSILIILMKRRATIAHFIGIINIFGAVAAKLPRPAVVTE